MTGAFWKGYCLIYRYGLGHETTHEGTIPCTDDCQINYRSCHDSHRLKIVAQNHTNFHLTKIVGISKGSEKIWVAKRFLTCIWWFWPITKRFLTIPFHENTKIFTYSGYFWSQKGFLDQILGFGTKLLGSIAHCVLHQILWKFQCQLKG